MHGTYNVKICLFTAGDAVSDNQYPGVVVNQMYEITNGEWCRTEPTLISNGYDLRILLNVHISILQKDVDSEVLCYRNTLTFLAYMYTTNKMHNIFFCDYTLLSIYALHVSYCISPSSGAVFL